MKSKVFMNSIKTGKNKLIFQKLRMIETNILFLYLLILVLIQVINLSKGEAVEKWIEQFQDHFDPNNGFTWWMRYYENDELFEPTGPMFIMIGGEEPIIFDEIETGFMYEIAEICGAILYHIEHRYYGKSQPVPNTSLENLKYLNVRQTLSDIGFFIIKKKEELNNPNIPVIVFGSSYSGNLAAWMRIKYPKLVHAAVAISAPIYVTAEFPQYFEVIADSFRKYDENCVKTIEKAFSELEEVITDPVSNSIKLKNDFNLCNEPDFSESREITLMVSSFAQFIGNIVVYNSVESNGKSSIDNICTQMRENEENTSPYHRLARTINRAHLKLAPCLEVDYNNVAHFHRETDWTAPLAKNRIWNYQTCTELGYKQTFSSPKSIFGSRVTAQYFAEICESIFGEGYHADALYDNVERINLVYNTRLSNATNIIFINGDIDPWHALSVLHDLNDDSPAIFIPGTSHCQFLNPRKPDDSLNLIAARCKVAEILFHWLRK